jgi:VanZ family protein
VSYLKRREPMKKILLVVAFVMMACTPAGAQSQVDKVAHFGISAALGGVADLVVYREADLPVWGRVALSTGIALVPGVFKEVCLDAHADGWDLAADLAGALVGSMAAEWLQGYSAVVSKNGDAWGVRVQGKF